MNHLFKKTALTLMLCLPLFCLTAYGQTDFQNGYIIDYEGDTLRGLLKEQFADIGYNIHFKKSETSELEVKKTSDIKKYYLGFGHLYETHTLLHKEDSTTLFLKCLLLGDVSLYSFTDDYLKKYYYIKTDKIGLRELKYGKELLFNKKKNSYMMKTHDRYFGTLKLATQACPDLASRIDKLKFSERGVIEILRDYHYCINRDFAEMTSSEKVRGKFGFNILAGPNFITTNEENLPAYDGKMGFDAGVFISYLIPNSRDRYSAEIGYFSSNYLLEERATGEVSRLRIDQIPVFLNIHSGSEKNRYNLKAGYSFAVFGPLSRWNSILVGAGYDRKIGKVRLRTNLEYRWGTLKTIGIHAGIGF